MATAPENLPGSKRGACRETDGCRNWGSPPGSHRVVSSGNKAVRPSDRDASVGGGVTRSTEEAGQRPQREGVTQDSLFGESNTAAPEADKTVSTKLAGLVARARKEARLTNVVQYVDEELLRLAFRSLRRRAAPGVDGQRYEDYAANLDQNLQDLHARLKSGRYQAPVIRRVYIPKGNGKMRPLGITTIEDRVVQRPWRGCSARSMSRIFWTVHTVFVRSAVRTQRCIGSARGCCSIGCRMWSRSTWSITLARSTGRGSGSLCGIGSTMEDSSVS